MDVAYREVRDRIERARALRAQGKLPEAEPYYREALDGSRGRGRIGPGVGDRLQVGEVRGDLARVVQRILERAAAGPFRAEPENQ